MKFYVRSTLYGYNVDDILTAYPNIFGFQKEEIVEEVANGKNIRYRLAARLDTAGDILEFINEVGNEIIIQNDDDVPEIEIYDSYRE